MGFQLQAYGTHSLRKTIRNFINSVASNLDVLEATQRPDSGISSIMEPMQKT